MNAARCLVFAAALLTASTAVEVPESAAAELSRPEIIALARPSVVHIKATPKPGAERARAVVKGKADPSLDSLFDRFGFDRTKDQQGSGFIIDGGSGLVLTAAHIVARAAEVTAEFADGSTRPAAVAGVDEDSGVALLRLSSPLPPALPLEERAPVPGESAMIVGWMLPAGSILAFDGMVMGELPGVNDEPAAPPLARYTAIDAAIPNGGFGGSPVLDRAGKVIGFVSAIYGRTYGQGTLTLMIPAQGLRPIIDALNANGRVRRSVIGITTECVKAACVVQVVDQPGPAFLAGVREGDRIVSIDGARMTSDAAIRRAIALKPAGSSVLMQMLRGDHAFTVGVRTSVAE